MSKGTPSDGLFKVVRERIFFEHSSPNDRQITDEITILNITDNDIRTIFLVRHEFMIGLKIYDENDEELPYYPNDFAITLLQEDRIMIGCMSESKHQDLLNQMKEHKAFFIWIALPQHKPLFKKASLILKLKYTTKKETVKKNIKEMLRIFLKPSMFVFTIPKFIISREKDEADYDTFYIVTVPEGYKLNYKINKAKYLEISNNGKEELDISTKKKIYENFDGKTLSIMTPSMNNKTKFEIIYHVTPTNTEKSFYLVAVIASIAVSIIILTSGLIDSSAKSNVLFKILNAINDHLPTVGAGLITSAIAAIGFTKGYAFNKTRLWFLVPIIVSIVSILLHYSK